MSKKTEAEQGTIQENEGTNLYGFQDPTGEFPREDYWGESSINRAARGAGGVGQKEKPNDLTMSAVFPNIDMGLGTATQGEDGTIEFETNTGRSKYPYNKVTETYSGHVIEIDDTEGNERVLIRHRTGSGIEMRKDGSIWISATKDKYETVGADCKIVVEGNTEIAYEGNLDMWVGGNFNLDVGGNQNIKIKGNKNERVAKDHKHRTSGNSEYTTKGNAKISTMGIHTDACLGDLRKTITKGKHEISAEGAVDLVSDTTLLLSGKSEAVMVSTACNISGTTVSAIGMKGSFGGDFVDFFGKSYSGPLGPQPYSGACFYGSVVGTSLFSTFSQFAGESLRAGTAGALGAPGWGLPTVPPGVAIPPTSPPPNTALVGLHLAGGAYAIRTVTIDAGGVLKSKILKTDSYGGVFDDGEPTTQEARSAMRDASNKDAIGASLAVDGVISDKLDDVVPPNIGRTAGKARTTQFGNTPLGNTIKGLGKQFTVSKLEEEVELPPPQVRVSEDSA
jgi:hypothetical protein